MIAQLVGAVARVEGNSVIVDVNGVGYQVFTPVTVLANLPAPGSKVILHTHLIVREEEWSLYGFAEPIELQVFKMLLTASGVGPKVALALLSTLTVSELGRALSTNDTRVITKVPGVGPKLASRLCLELGDRMAEFAFAQRTAQSESGKATEQENAAYEDALEGLISLGYGRADARRAMERVFATVSDRTNVGTLISSALALLTAGKG
jgi:Holliday junction DNA helicase RuvA